MENIRGFSQMVHPISSATQVTAVQPSTAARQPAPAAAAKPQAPAPDTVRISVAAKALQELTETSVQTGQEARAGDVQAIKLQAKEAAAQNPTK
jgi:hypothetical protein